MLEVLLDTITATPQDTLQATPQDERLSKIVDFCAIPRSRKEIQKIESILKKLF